MRLSSGARGFESHRLRQNKAAPKALFCFGGDRERDSNPKGREREARQSGGLSSRERGKPTERGGAGRRMRSIRVNPTVSAKCERGLAPLFAFDGKGFEPGAGRRELKQDLLLHYYSCISGICNNRCHEGSMKTISSRFFLCRSCAHIMV